jgi:hypothetical protein
MHTIDLGLFKYMLDYTRELLHKQCESKVTQTFEQRLTLIPRFQGLKIIKNVSDINRMTADELRNLMKIIIFAIDNIYKKYQKPDVSNKQLCQVYYKFLRMYIATRNESFTYSSCNQLQVIFF